MGKDGLKQLKEILKKHQGSVSVANQARQKNHLVKGGDTGIMSKKLKAGIS